MYELNTGTARDRQGPPKGWEGSQGAAGGREGPPGAARNRQEARGYRKGPSGAAMSRQEPPEAARSLQGPPVPRGVTKGNQEPSAAVTRPQAAQVVKSR